LGKAGGEYNSSCLVFERRLRWGFSQHHYIDAGGYDVGFLLRIRVHLIPLLFGLVGAALAFLYTMLYFFILAGLGSSVHEPGFSDPILEGVILGLVATSLLGFIGAVVSLVNPRVSSFLLAAGGIVGLVSYRSYFSSLYVTIQSVIFFPWWSLLLMTGGFYEAFHSSEQELALPKTG